MTEPARIDPEAWYEENALHRLGFSTGVLARARKAGELRCRNAGRNGRAIYKGAWVEAWLADGERDVLAEIEADARDYAEMPGRGPGGVAAALASIRGHADDIAAILRGRGGPDAERVRAHAGAIRAAVDDLIGPEAAGEGRDAGG